MNSFTYHSPEGDRPLFAKGENEDDTVDLVNGEGVLEIGKCRIGSEVGQCSKNEPEPVAEVEKPHGKHKKH